MSRKNGVITICHVISGDIWGGAEAQAYSLIKSLACQDDISIEVVVFNNGHLYKKLSKENIDVHYLDENAESLISLILNLYRYIKKISPDIIHTHGFKENFTAGIASKFFSVKVVRTHHGKGMITGKGFHTYIEKINDLFLTRCSIAVSYDLKNYLVDCGFKRVNIEVIHNGYNCEDVAYGDVVKLKESIGIGERDRVIGIVGRLVPVKNHHGFLDSAKIILSTRDDVYFCVIGEGPLMKELEQYSRALGIDENVKFLGFNRNIKALLELLDIFAMASFHEGVPMSMLEAMCAGVPIVSTRVGGIPEIIQDDYNGLLVSHNDCAAFSDACLRLLNDGALCERLACNAIEDMKQKYSMNINANETIVYYKSIIL